MTWAVAAPGTVRRRAAGLAVAAIAVVLSSAWWVAAMDLLPAASRAYVGGSTNNTALDLVLGYDGLGRIFGEGGGPGGGGPGGGGPGGGGFSGVPGILRLFNDQLGGQVAWLLPMAVVGAIVGLVARARAPRTDLARAGILLWGVWLVVHVVVFSLMAGVIHSYYTVVLAPAIGALTGAGVVALWRLRERVPWAGLVLGLAIAGSAVLAWSLLDRSPAFVPGLGVVVVAVAALVLVIVALRPRPDRAPAQLGAIVLGLAVLLAGPAAYAAYTMTTAYGGGDPAAGPATAGVRGGPGGFGGGFATGAQPGAIAGTQPLGGFGGGPGGGGVARRHDGRLPRRQPRRRGLDRGRVRCEHGGPARARDAPAGHGDGRLHGRRRRADPRPAPGARRRRQPPVRRGRWRWRRPDGRPAGRVVRVELGDVRVHRRRPRAPGPRRSTTARERSPVRPRVRARWVSVAPATGVGRDAA